MFLSRKKKNYFSIILNTPSYLELCKGVWIHLGGEKLCHFQFFVFLSSACSHLLREKNKVLLELVLTFKSRPPLMYNFTYWQSGTPSAYMHHRNSSVSQMSISRPKFSWWDVKSSCSGQDFQINGFCSTWRAETSACTADIDHQVLHCCHLQQDLSAYRTFYTIAINNICPYIG